MRPVSAHHCQRWQLRETGRDCYNINELADFHEMMDEEAEMQIRFSEAAERDRERK